MVLFINGCVREKSRTLELANELLSKITDEICTVNLYPDGVKGLDAQRLSMRDELCARGEYDHPSFEKARQFADADVIVLAAPYWDLSFPAGVRAYLEEITVSGITFRYGEDGRPHGLCKAKKLFYVTTSGGPLIRHYGYEYVEALGRVFYGIEEFALVKAEGLDIWGADTDEIMEKAKSKICELI